MARGQEGFKKALFGGFDRRTVIKYIEKLAEERNSLRKENEALSEELDAARERLAETEITPEPPPPPPEPDHSEEREAAARALSEARRLVTELRGLYGELLADFRIDATQAEGDLARLSTRLPRMTKALEDVDRRLEELSGSLMEHPDEEKKEDVQ